MRFPKILAVLTFLAFVSDAPAAPQPVDRIVAVVNNGVVLQSELDRAIRDTRQQIKQRGIGQPPEDVLRTQVLERLVLVRVQTQRAQEAGIRVDDRELNEVLTNIATQNRMSLSDFANAVRKEGMDFLAVREQVRDEVLMNRLRQKEVESRVVVTDQDIALFLASQSKADETEYRLSHILIAVPDGASSDARGTAKAKAETLLKRIKNGEDFAQLAIANSDGQQALQGGDLDWRKGGDLPELFAREVVKMKPGDAHGVLESAAGYHIIKLVGERGGEGRKTVTETHALHILLQSNAVRTEEQTRLQAQDLYARVKKGEDFAELAKKFSDDPGSKAAGGDLGWQPPGVFAPEFQTRIDQLQPGQISTPFHTQFGWHIARLLERRTRDTTEESRRARARAAIQNRKAAEEYETWLRRLRDEAYVEYRMKGEGGDKPSSDKPSS